MIKEEEAFEYIKCMIYTMEDMVDKISTAADILSEDQNECRVSIAFINCQVAWECSAEHSQGKFLLQKEGNEWKIVDFSQTYYDDLIQGFEEDF